MTLILKQNHGTLDAIENQKAIFFLLTVIACLSHDLIFFFSLQVVLLDTARELCLEEKSNDVRDNSNNVRNGTATVIKMTVIIIKK